MKLLCTGDLHINDWIPFSTIDKYGRPSRLVDYLKLAKTIKDLADKEKCDAIIIAGDISEASTQRPMVHDVIGDFLRICAKNVPVHLIHGQHDASSKEATSMGQNSILKEICKDLQDQKVFYYPEPELINIGPHSFYFQSWTHGHELEGSDADIFVGHGIVTGCSNLDGYIFMNGFDVEDLCQKYKVSIIGDIHKRQLHNSKIFGNRIVLQPGSPIQNTWKDHVDCGLYTLEVSKDSPKVEFFSIHDLAPNTFHQFVYDQESTDLIHSRPKVGVKSQNKGLKKSLEIKRDNTVIYNTCIKLIEEDQEVKNTELVTSFLSKVFENTALNSDKVISNTVLKKVSAYNFLSIDKFEMDFNEFPKSCVITGQNGTGKTTIPEAIYWCLTGNTTKSINISEVINKFKKEEECYVELCLIVNNQDLKIKRERRGKSSGLTIFDQEDNAIKFSSIRETQNEVYKILGLQEWQLYMFSYFSAEKTNLFANLGDSSKGDLTSQIVGLDFVESMRMYSKKEKNELKNESLILEGVIAEKQSVINNSNRKLKKLEEESEDNSPKIKKEITTIKNQLLSMEEEYKNKEDLFLGKYKDYSFDLDKESKVYYNLQKEYEKSKSKKFILDNNLKNNKGKLKQAIEGKCPTCDQELHNLDLISKLKEDISKDFNSLKELPDLEEIKNKLETLNDNLKESNQYEKEKRDLQKENNELQKEQNKLNLRIMELKELLSSEKYDNKAIEDLKIDIKNNELELEKSQKTVLNLNKKLKAWTYLENKLFKRNGELVRELNKQGAKLIQQCIDELLVGLNIEINISTDLNLSGKFHSTKINYEAMSSGQKRLTDIVLMVALNNLFSKIYNLENGIIGLSVYDEILSFLDDKYIDYAKQIVDQSISNKILIITHDTNLMNMYDSKIKVSLNKTGSNYVKSWA